MREWGQATLSLTRPSLFGEISEITCSPPSSISLNLPELGEWALGSYLVLD